MSIRPLNDRLLVKRVEKEQKTAGGIIIPDTAKEKPQEATVVAVGNGKRLDDGKVLPLEVKVGDTILFSKYAGTEVKIEGEEHLILREDDVIGIVE
jgi:chaperonin GroES